MPHPKSCPTCGLVQIEPAGACPLCGTSLSAANLPRFALWSSVLVEYLLIVVLVIRRFTT